MEKWTLLRKVDKPIDIHVTSEGADIEVLGIKGEPGEDDFGYWLSDGETKIVPLLKYESLYIRQRKQYTSDPKITLD